MDNKRRIYFINRSFQAKFILQYFSLLTIGGLLTVGILYLLATQSTTVNIINSRIVARTTADAILPIIIQAALIVLVLIGFASIVMTLIVSHRIAGPLYRFNKVIEKLGEGDLCSDFKIRRLDQLQDLAGNLNTMIKSLREHVNLLKDQTASLEGKIDSLSNDEASQQQRALLNDIKKTAAQLSNTINYFKSSCP